MDREMFPQLLGNEKIKNNLAVDAANNKSAHAYIIEGVDGSGKHLLAKLISAASVCTNRDTPSHPVPCGVCPTCHRILNDISADVTVVSTNGKASIGVEAIRNLKQTLYVTPNDGEKKFYIIENAELMTVQAQNSLLLSLEEPPEYVMFFLLTTHSAGLLETIRSRAPTVRMESFSPKAILEFLRSGKFLDPRAFTEDRLTEAAYLADGAIGQAITLLEDQEETTDRRRIAALLAENLVEKTRPSELLEFVSDNLLIEREAVLDILLLARTAVRDMIALKKSDEDSFLFYFSEEDMPKSTRRISVRKLLWLYEILRQAHENISMNGSVSTALTELVLKKDKSR